MSNEAFVATADGEVFHGGSGTDTVSFSGNASGYRIDSLSNGTIQVVDIDAGDGDTGTTTLTGIETLSFSDHSYSPVREAAGPVQGEIQVNTDNSHLQKLEPAIASLPDGGYIVTWAAIDGFSEYGIRAQRFSADGNFVGSEVIVNSVTVGNQASPAIAVLADGGYVITWSSSPWATADIQAQRFDANGNPVGPETRINTFTNNSQLAPEIASLPDGGWVITWTSWFQDGLFSSVHSQRYDVDGNPDGVETRVNTTTPDQQQGSAIGTLADGSYMIVWTSQSSDGYGGSRYELFGQRYDANGDPEGAEQHIESSNNPRVPVVTGLANGEYVVAWLRGSDGQVICQRFDSNGVPVGAETQVTLLTTGLLSEHGSASGARTNALAITTLADGGYVIAWNGAQPGEKGIYLQRFDADGNAIGSETQVNTYVSSFQFFPSIAALADGGYVVTWQIMHDETGYEIYSQRYDAEGNLYAPHTITLTGTGNDDTINGGIGAQVLAGLAGNDTLSGGDGDDTYILDDTDTIIEVVNGGTDTVKVSFTHTLGNHLENLILTGSADIDGNGNSADNIITGNSGDNILDGGDGDDALNGAAGADILIGGLGDDTYILDDTDAVVEAEGEGTDTVRASVSHALGNHVENLVLTGSADIDGNGNSGDNIITGNSGDNTLDGEGGSDTLIGKTGDDTYIIGAEDTVVETENQGTDTIRTGFSYTLGDHLENLVLTGASNIDGAGNTDDNALTGNTGDNTLDAGGGNDTLDGGAGTDILIGGLGNDTYVLNDLDTITEADDEGTDTVRSSLSYTLGSNLEHLVLTGSANINGTGNNAGNVITGNAGDNVLDGDVGNDTALYLHSAAGYRIDYLSNGDIEVVDINTVNGDTGTDRLVNIESVWFSDQRYQIAVIPLENGASALSITGTNSDDTIVGGAGSQILDGLGGNDTLIGGAGNDIYIGGSGNHILEYANGGTDTLKSHSSSWLSNEYLENLVLTGTANISGEGNDASNVIIGNSGANRLDGGKGKDTLKGGLGNDTYLLADADLVIELAKAGTDTVRAEISYVLPTNVENLTLTGTNNDGTGNTANNIIIGSFGDNALYGLGGNDKLSGGAGDDLLSGGAGSDHLSGGTGNDSYILTDKDVIVENKHAGEDIVQTTFSYTLGSNLEHLVLAGSSAINGTGNPLDNVLVGNNAGNKLYGAAGDDILFGGSGNDRLTGGSGRDIFVFDSKLQKSATNLDTITDYARGSDAIGLDKTIFTKLQSGILKSDYFRASANGNAVDRNDFILYETDTGKLFYDADGSGIGSKIQFALIGTLSHPSLSASDFIVA